VDVGTWCSVDSAKSPPPFMSFGLFFCGWCSPRLVGLVHILLYPKVSASTIPVPSKVDSFPPLPFWLPFLSQRRFGSLTVALGALLFTEFYDYLSCGGEWTGFSFPGARRWVLYRPIFSSWAGSFSPFFMILFTFRIGVGTSTTVSNSFSLLRWALVLFSRTFWSVAPFFYRQTERLLFPPWTGCGAWHCCGDPAASFFCPR